MSGNAKSKSYPATTYCLRVICMLDWTKFDADGSIMSKGKKEYYVILVRGVPEKRPKDCVIELYTTPREMTVQELKYKTKNEKVELLSRIVVLGKLSPNGSIVKAVEEMKLTALKRENKNPYGAITSAYNTK